MPLTKIKAAAADSINTKSASDPATNTNPSAGVGHIWLNTTSGEMYCCTDATTNANVWVNIGDGTGDVKPFTPMAATGGTVTTVGDYKVHTFNSSDTFTVSQAGLNAEVELLLIAGGGSAGGSDISTGYGNERGGGGGAGGYRHITNITNLANSTDYPIVIGAGGSYQTLYQHSKGNNSEALSYTTTGGGAGGISRYDNPPLDPYNSDPWSGYDGRPGGSGGGAMGTNPGAPGGDGNQGGYNPVEGYAGGSCPSGGSPDPLNSGGGGGSSGVGTYGSGTDTGGPGTSSTINGTAVTRAAGGHVADNTANGNANSGDGGSSGINVTGSGSGGSGVVIIRYKFQ